MMMLFDLQTSSIKISRVGVGSGIEYDHPRVQNPNP